MTVLDPPEYATGKLIYPYGEAKKSSATITVGEGSA
jgi:hypothetical protein